MGKLWTAIKFFFFYGMFLFGMFFINTVAFTEASEISVIVILALFAGLMIYFGYRWLYKNVPNKVFKVCMYLGSVFYGFIVFIGLLSFINSWGTDTKDLLYIASFAIVGGAMVYLGVKGNEKNN
ncbi:MAG: hypothetical protein HUJ58_01135 [Erysipelotrichaceae bacterium]|nr:hypothetical protein [Erysipelotrichaceae bacterium]